MLPEQATLRSVPLGVHKSKWGTAWPPAFGFFWAWEGKVETLEIHKRWNFKLLWGVCVQGAAIDLCWRLWIN